MNKTLKPMKRLADQVDRLISVFERIAQALESTS